MHPATPPDHRAPARATRLAAGAALGLALALVPCAATAQRCPTMSGASPALADADPNVRLGYIQRRLQRGAGRSRVWAYTWGTAYGAVTTVQAVRLATTEDYTTRMESAIAAGSAALGLGSLVILPPTILADSARLRVQVSHLRPGEDVCATLRDAENYLERDASNQAFGVGPLMQAVTLAYNVGLGLVFGFWLHDWTGAAITIGSGVAVSELMIFTQPTDAIDALRRYRVGDLRPTTAPSTSYWVVAPDVGPDRAGLVLRGVF